MNLLMLRTVARLDEALAPQAQGHMDFSMGMDNGATARMSRMAHPYRFNDHAGSADVARYVFVENLSG